MKNFKYLVKKENSNKVIFTAGPASLIEENILEYLKILIMKEQIHMKTGMFILN